LELSGSPLSDKTTYRDDVFALLPGLLVLDGKNKSGEEVEEVGSDEDDEESVGDEFPGEIEESQSEEEEAIPGKRKEPESESEEFPENEEEGDEEEEEQSEESIYEILIFYRRTTN